MKHFSLKLSGLLFLVIALVVGVVLIEQIQIFQEKAASADAINVKILGARGDGKTDDSLAIQRAIEAAANTRSKIVYVPTGVYLLGKSAGGVETYPNGQPIQSALIIDKTGITFQGDQGKSILQLMPNKKMRAISVTANNVTIQNIIVDGNKSHRNGSVPWPGGDVVDALVYAATNTKNVTVQNCEVRSGIEDGIGFWSSQNGLIQNCYSHDNGTSQAGGSGITISKTTNAKVSNNRSIHNTIGMWSSFGSQNVTFEKNVIQNNDQEGIIIGGSTPGNGLGDNSGFNILNNTITGNGVKGFAGISIFSSKNGFIQNNRVVNNFTGIDINDQGTLASTNWTVERNICSYDGSGLKPKFGIRVLGISSGILLRNNTCANNGESLADQIVVNASNSVNADWQKINATSFGKINKPSLNN